MSPPPPIKIDRRRHRVIDLMKNHARHSASAPPVAAVRAQYGRGTGERTEHGIARLLRWLAESACARPEDASQEWLQARRSDAVVLSSRLLIEPGSEDLSAAAQAMAALRPCLPDVCASVPRGTATAWSARGDGVASVLLAWPRGYTNSLYDAGHGAVVLSPALADAPDALRLAWREWLGLFNELQVLPNRFLMTREGMAHGDYAGLTPPSVPSVAPPTDVTQDDPQWEARMCHRVRCPCG
jgi:hypothetical protein